MLLSVFLCGLVGFATAIPDHPKLQNPVDISYETFEIWMDYYGIKYNTVRERRHRFEIWSEKVAQIQEHNSDSKNTWQKGVNQFTATTWKEKQETILMDPQDCSATDHHFGPKPIDLNELKAKSNGAPLNIDWRDQKVISEVKNQGDCGSCWTFSTTGCLEAHHAIETGQIVLLSEQNLVDCAGAYKNDGCDGGLPSQAFEYVRYNGGINTEFSYPYYATDGNCSYNTKSGTVGAIVDSVYNITQYSEGEIYDAVGLKGPVSIAFDVVDDFFDYQSGIYQSAVCGNTSATVNHAVLTVGYGTDDNLNDGMPYWIVKNSWDWDWGNQGYFYIERGVNMCGLAACASFPLLE